MTDKRFIIKFEKFHEFYIIDQKTNKKYGGFDRFEVKPAEQLCKDLNQMEQELK